MATAESVFEAMSPIDSSALAAALCDGAAWLARASSANGPAGQACPATIAASCVEDLSSRDSTFACAMATRARARTSRTDVDSSVMVLASGPPSERAPCPLGSSRFEGCSCAEHARGSAQRTACEFCTHRAWLQVKLYTSSSRCSALGSMSTPGSLDLCLGVALPVHQRMLNGHDLCVLQPRIASVVRSGGSKGEAVSRGGPPHALACLDSAQPPPGRCGDACSRHRVRARGSGARPFACCTWLQRSQLFHFRPVHGVQQSAWSGP